MRSASRSGGADGDVLDVNSGSEVRGEIELQCVRSRCRISKFNREMQEVVSIRVYVGEKMILIVYKKNLKCFKDVRHINETRKTKIVYDSK